MSPRYRFLYLLSDAANGLCVSRIDLSHEFKLAHQDMGLPLDLL